MKASFISLLKYPFTGVCAHYFAQPFAVSATSAPTQLFTYEASQSFAHEGPQSSTHYFARGTALPPATGAVAPFAPGESQSATSPSTRETTPSFSRWFVQSCRRSEQRISLTYTAVFVLIIIAVSAFAALRYDWLEAWIIAIMTAFVFMLSFVWMLRQVDLGIEMDLASSRIRVGDHAVGTLTIHARSKTPAFGTEVVMPVAHFSATFPLPLLHAGQNHVETFTIPARRRGVIQIGPVTTIHSDPLQLLQRSKTWNSPHQLYIHPSTIGLAHSVTGLLRDIEGASTRDLTSSDVSFHALRDYTPGDERRSIHWKTTAKMGRMMVRQFEETRRAQLLCILSLHPSFYFSEDEFELAVSVAASVGAHALHEGKTVSLVTDTTTFHVPNAMRFLDELSSVELSSQPMALPELVSHGVASLPQASVIMCITGSGTSVSLLHQAYSRMSINMQSIMCRSIDPGSTENPTPIREAPYFRPVPHQFHKVGVMNIIDIGDLSELPGLMGAVGR